jgi:3-oxoacyl-[acyl-carrier-protein] synthase II
MSAQRVVISGMGAVSPYGIGMNVLWDNLLAGKSAVRLISDFDVSSLPTRFAAQLTLNEVQLENYVENKKATKTMSRAMMFAMIAAQEAMNQSGLAGNITDPFRFGVSLGAGGLGYWDLEHATHMLDIVVDSLGPDNHLDYGKVWENTMQKVHPLTPLRALPNISAAHVAIQFNARGHCQTITTACTSSTQAVGEAFRLIKSGWADCMISGGSDAMINPNGMMAFNALGVVSKNNDEYETAARPFDKRRDGFMVGEGGIVFILEELEHCVNRGGTPLAEIIGYASTCDAFRLTDEPPEAWGAVKAMELTLADARAHLQDIDLINAHGTGTQMNDINETYAIKQVFGDHAYHIPVNSTKSMVGHLVAAAGAIELAACVQSIRTQKIHPTINYQVPDPACDLDYVPNTARQCSVNTVLSNSFGFGGQNACLLIRSVDN